MTVSGQLSAETYACALSNVYTFGPTFRAENSNTTRHLAEFWMIEPEMCFADLLDNMELAENYLKYSILYVLENNKEEIDFLEKNNEKGLWKRLESIINSTFEKVTYTDAINLFEKNKVKSVLIKGKMPI